MKNNRDNNNKLEFVLFVAPAWGRAFESRVFRCTTIARRRPPLQQPRYRIQSMCIGSSSSSSSITSTAGLGAQVATWLNEEYPEPDLQGAHSSVGQLAERHCDIIVRRGGNGTYSPDNMDMGELLVELGSRLEKERWDKDLFVGPWEVANKVSEFLMKKQLSGNEHRNSNITMNTDISWDGKLSFDMDDAFEKYNFIQRLLDGAVSEGEMGHVFATVAGFKCNNNSTWDNSGVESIFLKDNVVLESDLPYTILRTPGIAQWFELSLGIDPDNDPNGRKIDQLNTFISTVHGAQITGIQKKSGDHNFKRLETIAMWLHLYGAF